MEAVPWHVSCVPCAKMAAGNVSRKISDQDLKVDWGLTLYLCRQDGLLMSSS